METDFCRLKISCYFRRFPGAPGDWHLGDIVLLWVQFISPDVFSLWLYPIDRYCQLNVWILCWCFRAFQECECPFSWKQLVHICLWYSPFQKETAVGFGFSWASFWKQMVNNLIWISLWVVIHEEERTDSFIICMRDWMRIRFEANIQDPHSLPCAFGQQFGCPASYASKTVYVAFVYNWEHWVVKWEKNPWK